MFGHLCILMRTRPLRSQLQRSLSISFCTGAPGFGGVFGFTGSEGFTGFTGFTGASGPKGVIGQPGVDGVAGVRGVPGQTGFTGWCCHTQSDSVLSVMNGLGFFNFFPNIYHSLSTVRSFYLSSLIVSLHYIIIYLFILMTEHTIQCNITAGQQDAIE